MNFPKLTVILISVALFGLSVTVVNAEEQTTLLRLEMALNLALPEDPPIVLSIGTDFETTKLGTVIFLSRAEGMKRMVEIARAQKDELGMLYLPCWEAWITTSTKRGIDHVKNDVKYFDAAIAAEPEIEIWHTHSAKGVHPYLKIGENPDSEWAWYWITPSRVDLFQLYGFAEITGKENFRGMVANPHGVISYWSHDYLGTANQRVNPEMASMMERIYSKEVMHLQDAFRNAKPEEFQQRASAYRGVFVMRFEPVP